MLARVVAAVAFVAAAVGLVAVVATEGRLWGPEAAHSPQGSRIWLVPLLGLPHLVGLAAAVSARRSLACSLLVCAGASACAGLSVGVWAGDGLNRTERVLALLQTWAVQVLLCSVTVAGGWAARQEHREARATPIPALPPIAGDS